MSRHSRRSENYPLLVRLGPIVCQAMLSLAVILLVCVWSVFGAWHDISQQDALLVSGVVTWRTLDERIRSGRGIGHRDAFLPWLWVRRKNVSGRGNQVVDPLPGNRRASHFFAQIEWHVALLCKWLGAWDVREQVPLWPQPHEHLLADLVSHSKNLPPSRGLWQIAHDAGIDHGREIGSDAPYVATIDIAATLVAPAETGGPKLAGVSLKPHELILSAESDDRIVERLELERRYLQEAESHYVIVDRKLIGQYTGGNMETFSSGARLPERLAAVSLIDDFCAALVEAASLSPITDAIDQVGTIMRLQKSDANLLWRHGVWTRRIDVDITSPIDMRRPLGPGGKEIAAWMARQLFGEVLI